MSRVKEFFNKINNQLEYEGSSLDKWDGTSRKSIHLLQVKVESDSLVIYVKESNSSPGFWGLTKNQIERLNNSGLQWFCVLLLNSNNSGYLLTKEVVNQKIFNNSFELSKDGDYKVNERSDLVNTMFFSGVENLIKRLKSKI